MAIFEYFWNIKKIAVEEKVSKIIGFVYLVLKFLCDLSIIFDNDVA